MEEGDDVLWNSWSSNNVASILVDGQRINDVFSAIRKQLEWLKRQNGILREHIEQIGSSGVNPNDHIQVELEAMKQTIINLENMMYTNENNNKSKINDLQMQVQKLQEHNKVTDRKQAEQAQKIHDVESSFEIKILELKEAFDDHVRSSVSKNRELTIKLKEQNEESMDHKIRLDHLEAAVVANKDTIAVNEFKQRSADGRIIDLTEQLAHYKEIVNEFPTRYIDKINVALSDLYAEKADRIDLDRKADHDMIIMKAEQSEISRLEDITEEIHRRLTQQAREVGEGFTTLDGKVDKKMEKIAMWCLKQLRKELRKGDFGDVADGGGGGLEGHGYHHRGDGFGDIGRIKCLVCDQTIKQPQIAETGFGPSGMNNTIRPQHRSNSPPPVEKRGESARGRRDNNSNHTNNVYTAGAMANTGNSSPVFPAVNGPPVQYSHITSPAKMSKHPPQQHSKLVKMHNRPDANLQLHSTAEMEDPDYVVDFKYRMSGTGEPLPDSRQSTGQIAPIVNGLKTSASSPHVAGNGLHGAPTRYFKDLEEKYANGATRRSSGSAFDKGARPKSAPLKRVASNNNKLFANGKPVLVDIVDVL